MKTRVTVGIVAIILGAALAAAGSLSSPAGAQTSITTKVSIAAPQQFRDYLGPSGGQVQTIGEDQCSKALANRAGYWVCPSVGASAPAARGASRRDDGTQCNDRGACWTVKPTFYRATNGWTDVFGINTDVVGYATINSDNHLNGAQMRTVTYLSVDVSTRDLTAEGDLLYGSQDSRGDAVSGQYDIRVDSGQAAGHKWYPWGSGTTDGYKSYDKKYGNHANVIEYVWGKGTYIGTWWVYMKSVIANDNDNNDIFKFLDPGYRFWYSGDGGWHPE